MKRKITVVYNRELKEVEIENDTLVVPKNVTEVNCSDKGLKHIELHEKVKILFCFKNNLTDLDLLKDIEHVECWDNPLKKVKVPKNISYICPSTQKIRSYY